MAEYVVVDKEQLDADLSNVADAIREKGGTSESLEFPQGFVDGINAIESGGGGEDFIGVKYSNYGPSPQGYNLPKTADARSLDKILLDPKENTGARITAENNQCLTYMFANASRNANSAYFGFLEEVYLPSKATTLIYTFQNCGNLKNVYGDLSNIIGVGGSAFDYCVSLTDIPNMPNLQTIGNVAFRGCVGLTEITLPKTITTIHSGAFTGCTNIKHIYVPWAENAVANAPWGATNATIHYNSEV